MKTSTIFLKTTLISALIASNLLASQADIETKMSTLQKSIDDATSKGIDAEREKMTLHIADIYKPFIEWDKNNQDKVKQIFEKEGFLKKNAEKLANESLSTTINQLEKILDNAITTLDNVKKGKIKRPKTNEPDFDKMDIEGNRIVQDGKTVFMLEYIWKPDNPEYKKYFGDNDGILIAPHHSNSKEGGVSKHLINDIDKKADGRFGYIFMQHTTIPNWARNIENITVGKRWYTHYDIDNPAARIFWETVLKETVPLMANKKYTRMGYMLTNEPHWHTEKDKWATGEVSDFTIAKFREFLEKKHRRISTLNRIWGTHFRSFDKVEVEVPMSGQLQGSPIWYDFMTFNAQRVTEWFTFLHDEIKKYDSNAKTHLKVMPYLWSKNQKDHGLDFEELTLLNEIIGHDAHMHISYPETSYKDAGAEEKYSTQWRESCMTNDFFKSVSPEKLMFNSETHFIDLNSELDLNLNEDYIRMAFFHAAVTGTNAQQVWVWGRNGDGSIRAAEEDSSFFCTPAQQPQVLNSMELTEMDINSKADDIFKLQNTERPIRLFYSKTSAINDIKYMDNVYNQYKALYFEGMNLGFVTEKMLKNLDVKDIPFIILNNAKTVTKNEQAEIIKYLQRGGIVLADKESLHSNEYGKKLRTIKEKKYYICESIEEIKQKALILIKKHNKLPILDIKQTNQYDENLAYWSATKIDDNKIILAIANFANGENILDIKLRNSDDKIKIINAFTGEDIPSSIKLNKFGSYLLEITVNE